MTNQPIPQSQQTVLALANKQRELLQMVEQEPLLLPLLELATVQPGRERWQAYSALKVLGGVLVGWSARNPALATSAYYNTFCQAIDALLPEEATSDNPLDRLIGEISKETSF